MKGAIQLRRLVRKWGNPVIGIYVYATFPLIMSVLLLLYGLSFGHWERVGRLARVYGVVLVIFIWAPEIQEALNYPE